MSLAIGKTYIREMKTIEAELKRMNAKAKILRQQKQKAQDNLYNFMKKYGQEEYEGYKIEKIAPKIKVKSKPRKQVDTETMDMMRNAGIPDPEVFLSQLKSIRKPVKIDVS